MCRRRLGALAVGPPEQGVARPAVVRLLPVPGEVLPPRLWLRGVRAATSGLSHRGLRQPGRLWRRLEEVAPRDQVRRGRRLP